jgi:hypothetical protein
MGFVLAEDTGLVSNSGIIGDMTSCGGTQDPDACCQNLEYDIWDTETQECVNLENISVDPPIMDGGCASVAPDSQDECCINLGYETWNEETAECINISDPGVEPPIMDGGCASVAPDSQDECCRNLGYEMWDNEINECVNPTPVCDLIACEDGSEPYSTGEVDANGCPVAICELPDDPNPEIERVCCKIYGYGAEMREVNIKYEFIPKERCSIPEDFVGGNREIVEKEMCKQSRELPNRPRDLQEREKIRIQQVIQTRNRLQYMIQEANGTCPDNCTCDGSAMKCKTQDGNREMIIRAGKSGNTIVQVKNVNMSTSVALFKADDGGVFGVFRNNETKRIILPDEARERLHEAMKQRIKEEQRERRQIMLEDENITLNEEGYYEVKAKKKARLFWIVPVKERINTQIDAETGEIIKQRNPWWGFLARDVRVEDSGEEIPEEETNESA